MHTLSTGSLHHHLDEEDGWIVININTFKACISTVKGFRLYDSAKFLSFMNQWQRFP